MSFLALVAMLSASLHADSTIAVSGGEISYAGAEASTLPNGDVVLVFTNASTEGTFTLPKTAKAHLLLVGGGGAGGTVGNDLTRGAGGGGGAGGVSDRHLYLDSGTYTVKVGAGGSTAQTSVQSWVGDDGEISSISKGNDAYIASTRGGGGGGSVKIGGSGTPGGSGGGGSWYGDFQRGGSYTEGYGWSGGTPTDENYGGGGGGASLDSVEGTGGANGQAGTGRTNDITGVSVEYARGGRGGHRGDSSYQPAAGAGYGYGGDGAVNGLGGAGADGVVIVRISKIFDYKFVDFPTAPVYTNTFIWTEGENCIALDLAQADDDFRSAIARVEGVTNMVCSVTDGGATTNGLGRYKFILYLNDEYKWKDGTLEGNASPYGCSWKIKEPNVIGDITVDIKKTVEWFEGTNATIAIDVHSTPEKRLLVPNVLFVGSLCSAHGYSLDVITAAINAVTKVGNIDYRFYDTVTSATPTPKYSSSLSKGETFNENLTLKSGNHGSMYGLYESIAEAIDSGKHYDYIILSFDRTLTATSFNESHAREQDVVDFLKPLYEKNAVIWLVDNQPENDTTHNITQTPWYPSQLVCITTGNNQSWNSLYYYYYNYVVGNNNRAANALARSRRAWQALMGLFAPDKYDDCTDTLYNSNYDFSNQNAATIRTRVANLAGTAIKNQVVYNNATNVAKVVEDVVKPTIATMQLEDHIYLTNGLKIASVNGFWTTNETQQADSWDTATADWEALTSKELSFSDDDGIKVCISNLTTDAWLKLKIGVYDTGRFLSSVNATYNEQTGQWEKDPNDGPVQVKMTPDNGPGVLAEDEASTTVEWSFEAYKITGGVVWGDGEFIINGFYTNIISVAKGYNPEVLFRGDPGWAINYLEVDGVVLDDVNYKTNWFFENIGADHDIRVGFTNIVVNPPPPEVGPVTNVYDGVGYAPETVTPPTFVEGYEEYSNMWYMVYSTDPDADPTDRSAWSRDGVITNVVLDANGVPQPQTVYCRVCLEQPGYEDGAVVPYWIGTNTVTILPRELEVTFDDYVQTTSTQKTTGFDYEITGGLLIDGDTLSSNTGRCTDYPSKGGRTEDSITNNGAFYVTSADGSTDNYVITVIPGDYIYPDLDVVADADDIVKYYDAVATGLVVEVDFPLGGSYSKTTESDSDGTYEYSSRYSQTRISNGHVVGSGGTQYYNVISNWTDTTTTTVTCTETIEYSLDNGDTWTTVNPTFTDAGEYEVMYRVSYTSNITTTVTREVWLTGRSNWNSSSAVITGSRNTVTYPSTTTTVNYEPYVDIATITILPREVTVIADSAEKIYDGTALTKSTSTTDPTGTVPEGDQSGKGFLEGEGLASVPMTGGSTITLPGTVPNEVNSSAVTYKSGTNPDNYVITYVPGTLVVKPNEISATSTASDKVYNGTPNTSFSVTSVKDVNGDPLDPSKYTIKYKLHPWDDYTLDEPPANDTNSGEYVVYYKVIGADGYTSYEGYEVYKVTQRKVTLIADGAEKFYDGDPLVTNTFTVAAAKDPSTEGFVNGEGVSALEMTPGSTITEPGDKPNVIDPNVISNWVFTGGLTETTFKQNYVYTLIPSNLEVKVQARALWIIDHEDPGDGWVYLAFEPELLNNAEGADWIQSFADRGKFKAKYGRTRAEADACQPVQAVLSDKPGHTPTADKVWLKVSLKDVENVTVVEPEGFWRLVIDGPAKRLTDSDEIVSYGPTLQAVEPGKSAGGDIISTNGAVSVNTFGILKINSLTTNTLVAVPWTWYSKRQVNAGDIPVNKIVKTTNLDPGDMLYAYADNGSYAAWIVDAATNWTPCVTARVAKFGDPTGEEITTMVEGAGDKTISRGLGFWLHRNRPLDSNKQARPFWVYGQSVTSYVTNSVPGGTIADPSYIMLGNPYAEEVNIKDLDFVGTINGGSNEGDTIMIPDGLDASKFVYRRKNRWCWVDSQIVNGVPKNVYHYDDLIIPPGTGFWYIRRTPGELKVIWK